MSRAATFTQGDIQKLLKGARAAGLTVRAVTIDPTGRIVASFTGGDAPDAGDANPWDEVMSDATDRRSPAQRQRVS